MQGMYDAMQAFSQLQQSTPSAPQQPPQQQQAMPQQQGMEQGGEMMQEGNVPITEGVVPEETTDYTGEDVDNEINEMYGEVATEEEQEEVDMMVERGMEYIWDEDKSAQLATMIQTQQEAEGLGPHEVIGKIAAELMQIVDEEVEGDVDEELIVPIVTQYVEQLSEFAAAGELLNVSEDTPTKAAFVAYTKVMEAYGVDEDETVQDIEGMDPTDLERIVQTGFKAAEPAGAM